MKRHSLAKHVRSRWISSGIAALLLIAAGPTATGSVATGSVATGQELERPSPRDEIGWSSLAARLWPEPVPDGRGVRVGQVELGPPDEYAPGDRHPEFIGLPILTSSGPSTASLHATLVGSWFYGRDSGVAPGVEAVDAWEVHDWLGAGFLNGPGPMPPRTVGIAVMNNSWVGDAGPHSAAYLRKLDAAVEEQGLVVVAGSSNGPGDLTYPLAIQFFNGIAVGRADGWHAAGETSYWIDGPGRSKPDLVAPAPATSFAAPLVAGAAAILIQTAREHPTLVGNTRALEPEVLKAVLMAGARHRPAWSNHAPTGGRMRGATQRPLDAVFGTGVLDIDASHAILTAGEAPSAPRASDAPVAGDAGWLQLEIGAGESRWVRLSIDGARPSASVVATWNRHVLPGYEDFEIPDLDLELYAVGVNGEPTRLVGSAGLTRFRGGNVLSHSDKDNVEHLRVEGLAPGEYLLELRRTKDDLGAWPVALAWRFSSLAPRAYGRSKQTSLGSLPVLTAREQPSLSAGRLRLEIEGGLPYQPALLLQGRLSTHLLVAGVPRQIDTPEAVTLRIQLDEGGAARIPVEIGPGRVGDTRFYQVLFRDPAHPDGSGLGYTAGLEVELVD